MGLIVIALLVLGLMSVGLLDLIRILYPLPDGSPGGTIPIIVSDDTEVSVPITVGAEKLPT